MYLEATKRRYLKALDEKAPEPTSDLYEHLLPYAYALGTGKTWTDTFTALLDAEHYCPAWYHGASPFQAASFIDDMTSISLEIKPYN